MKNSQIILEKFPKEMPQLYYGVHRNDLGALCLITTKEEFVLLEFLSTENTEQDVLKQYPGVLRSQEVTGDLFSRFLLGSPTRVFVQGTQFQVRVWKELAKIEKGQVTSYQDIAKKIGNPKAVRAVGSAVGANPVSLIIPCHRVLRKNGELGGYRWGVEIKQKVLLVEKEGR